MPSCVCQLEEGVYQEASGTFKSRILKEGRNLGNGILKVRLDWDSVRSAVPMTLVGVGNLCGRDGEGLFVT